MKDLELLKIDTLTETKIIISGGKFHYSPITETDRQLDKLSQKHRIQGIMINATTGGFNFSGWKKNKLSKKSKDILQNVYGIEVIDE